MWENHVDKSHQWVTAFRQSNNIPIHFINTCEIKNLPLILLKFDEKQVVSEHNKSHGNRKTLGEKGIHAITFYSTHCLSGFVPKPWWILCIKDSIPPFCSDYPVCVLTNTTHPIGDFFCFKKVLSIIMCFSFSWACRTIYTCKYTSIQVKKH